jgi:MYXO-CTERM domain-containing protein
MILLEASSAMLNVDGGASFGGPGETGWDQARAALTGEASIFTAELGGDASVEDLVHLGLAVYGHDEPAPGEHELLVQYGPCMRDNFAWALDPDSSCEAPGCEDPWGGPIIEWSFKDGAVEDPPGFDAPTRSHMPQCAGAEACAGSGAFLHLGLELIAANQAAYYAAASEPEAPFPANPATTFINILVTRGDYAGYSTDAQVQAALEAMHADGITTYVIAFGDGSDTPEALETLTKLAGWGSGGELGPYAADGQAELAATLVAIIDAIAFDPCCAYTDCSENPEPTTGEPDPTPTTGEESTDTGTEGSTGDTGESSSGEESTDTGTEGSTGGSSEGVGDEIGDEASGDTVATGDSLGDDLPTDEGCECSASAGGGRTSAFALGLALFLLARRRRRRD